MSCTNGFRTVGDAGQYADGGASAAASCKPHVEGDEAICTHIVPNDALS